jgi:hypothetical protein
MLPKLRSFFSHLVRELTTSPCQQDDETIGAEISECGPMKIQEAVNLCTPRCSSGGTQIKGRQLPPKANPEKGLQ